MNLRVIIWIHFLQVKSVINDLIVFVGNNTAIPCNISPPNFDDTLKAIIWYNSNSDNPIYTLDARNNQTDQMKHFTSDLYKNRAFFNFTYPISYLRIKPVQEQDEGEYRCRIDFKRGRTINYSSRLKVICK